MPRPLEDATGLIIHGPLSLAKQSEIEAGETRGDSDRQRMIVSVSWREVYFDKQDQVRGGLLQNSWYSEGSTKVWGTIWKFLKPWACCIRWMFLYRRSLRVSSYDLERSRASTFKTPPLQLRHWQNKNIYIHNSNRSPSAWQCDSFHVSERHRSKLNALCSGSQQTHCLNWRA